jgi:hypothetical protein
LTSGSDARRSAAGRAATTIKEMAAFAQAAFCRSQRLRITSRALVSFIPRRLPDTRLDGNPSNKLTNTRKQHFHLLG